MENVKFKRCVISDVSYGCGLLTLTVNTKAFKRYSTGLKRIKEVLENTFDEYTANTLLTELYRAENNSFDDCNSVCRGGHSCFGGIACKYVVDFYYSSAEHFKGDAYVKSMLCVISVYLRGDTSISDILLSDSLLSPLFADDTAEDTAEDTADDTAEDTAKYTVCLGSLDDIPVTCLAFEWCHAPFDTVKACYNCAFNQSCDTAVKYSYTTDNFQILPLWVYSQYNINPVLTVALTQFFKALGFDKKYTPPHLYCTDSDKIVVVDDTFLSEDMPF